MDKHRACFASEKGRVDRGFGYGIYHRSILGTTEDLYREIVDLTDLDVNLKCTLHTPCMLTARIPPSPKPSQDGEAEWINAERLLIYENSSWSFHVERDPYFSNIDQVSRLLGRLVVQDCIIERASHDIMSNRVL